MFSKTALRGFALLLLCSQWALAQPFASGQPLVQYLVPRAHTEMHIDGHLDEFSWELAPQISQFERILNHYDGVQHPTRARMLWDDGHFYFAFSCQDPDIWAIFDQEDDQMWSEEVVEVFIDPDGDARNYLELEVNPLNAWVDLRIREVRPGGLASSKDWDIQGLKTAVQVYGTVNDTSDVDLGWTCEIAIPWAAMADSIDGGGRPEAGDTWRLNLYRIERTAGRASREQIKVDGERPMPLRRQLGALLEEAGVESPEELDLEGRPDAAELISQIELLQKEIESRSEAYGEATEYTTWSETYQRGFHHPGRFGIVQFGE
ncbi:carbohydrate-binding family 9-like protein [Candidatus Latescibacterota bacterium]